MRILVPRASPNEVHEEWGISPYQNLVDFLLQCSCRTSWAMASWTEKILWWTNIPGGEFYWVLGRSEWQLVLGAVELESPTSVESPTRAPALNNGASSPLVTVLSMSWDPKLQGPIRTNPWIWNLQCWIPHPLGPGALTMGLPLPLGHHVLSMSWDPCPLYTTSTSRILELI